MLYSITTKDSLNVWRDKINLTIDAVNAMRSTTNATTGGGTGAVSSVAGKQGAVTLYAGDIQDLGSAATAQVGAFASYLQGLKADTALQQATADLRYVRTVNGNPPNGSGDVTVAGGGSLPDLIDCGTFGLPPDGGTVTPGGPDLIDAGLF